MMARQTSDRSNNTGAVRKRDRPRRKGHKHVPILNGWMTSENVEDHGITEWMTSRTPLELRKEFRKSNDTEIKNYRCIPEKKCRLIENMDRFERESLHETCRPQEEVQKESQTSQHLPHTSLSTGNIISPPFRFGNIKNDKIHSLPNNISSDIRSEAKVRTSSSLTDVSKRSYLMECNYSDVSEMTSRIMTKSGSDIVQLRKLASMTRGRKLCKDDVEFIKRVSRQTLAHKNTNAKTTDKQNVIETSLNKRNEHINGIKSMSIGLNKIVTPDDKDVEGTSNNKHTFCHRLGPKEIKLVYQNNDSNEPNTPLFNEKPFCKYKLDEQTMSPKKTSVTKLVSIQQMKGHKAIEHIQPVASESPRGSLVAEVNENPGTIALVLRNLSMIEKRSHLEKSEAEPIASKCSEGEDSDDKRQQKDLNVGLPKRIQKHVESTNSDDILSSLAKSDSHLSFLRNNAYQDNEQVAMTFFPIGELLPAVENRIRNSFGPHLQRAPSMEFIYARNLENFVTNDSSISGKDMLFHNYDQSVLIRNGYDVLRKDANKSYQGPSYPAFRPQNSRTPLQRAREMTKRRMVGQVTFTDEGNEIMSTSSGNRKVSSSKARPF